MKPSKDSKRIWIRTKNQLTEAEEKQRKFDHGYVIKFLQKKDFANPGFELDSKGRMILIDNKTGTPLKLTEILIDEISKKTGLLSGKWLIYVQREHVDKLWNEIQKLADEDKIWSAKVSTSAHPWASEGKHVICVYTENYLDERDVIKTREVLRQIGIENRLTYKPDIYTLLGIYSDNKKSFNLNRVTRYII